MEKKIELKIELLKDIFEAELTMEDLDREVGEVLAWDSFHIMEFLVGAEEEFQRRITVEQISAVRYVCDLLSLLEEE